MLSRFVTETSFRTSDPLSNVDSLQKSNYGTKIEVVEEVQIANKYAQTPMIGGDQYL